MKRILTLWALIIAAVTGFCFDSAAQSTSPVRWRTTVRQTAPGEGVVTFRALVASGWHLYGMQLPSDGPKPTTFDLSGSADIEFTGKVTPARKAVRAVDPLFSSELEWWDSNVEFTVPFKVSGEAPVLHCVIGYMACDGTTCRPPARETVSTPVKLK